MCLIEVVTYKKVSTCMHEGITHLSLVELLMVTKPPLNHYVQQIRSFDKSKSMFVGFHKKCHICLPFVIILPSHVKSDRVLKVGKSFINH